jgi:hypothetical protein
MNRNILEKFISKYTLGGACDSVTFDCSTNDVKVRGISSDKNVLCEVTMNQPFLPTGRYSVYETSRLRSMIGILSDTFLTKPLVNGDVAYAVHFTDQSNTEMTFVLSDESIIPPVPDLKTLPEFELKVDIDETFVNTFVKAKGALAESDTFTISSNNGKTDVVLGFSTSNTNRIKLNAKSNDVGSFSPISFSATYLKEILTSNKDVTQGVMEVSSTGLARIIFHTNDISSTYYLVQMAIDV